MWLGVVAESLKPVKLLATCKPTQQLPTMLYEVFGSNAMATKLWRELQISLSNKVPAGAHLGAKGGTPLGNEIRLLCFVSLTLALFVLSTSV